MQLELTAQRAGRLSSFLRGELKMSLGLVNRLKWNGVICVNGQPCYIDHAVLPGDTITAFLEEEKPDYPAQEGELCILYEDAYLLAVDKPAGMLIHPSRAQNENTLANYVCGYYEKCGKTAAFHPVTRLDRDTFGAVLLAKDARMHALLQAAEVEKEYRASVFGGPQEDFGVIDAPIARRPLPSLLRYVDASGKTAVTQYRVLWRGAESAILALRPITGRTHQLRVHCAYMGFPILGDPQYGSEQSQALSARLGYFGQQLCAHSIRFVHPITGEPLEIRTKMDITASNADDAPGALHRAHCQA